MKERPILFSGPMVCALLDGSKTQTRRAIPEGLLDKYCSYDDWCNVVMPRSGDISCSRVYEEEFYAERCRYGFAGDRLWVRETFALFGDAERYVVHYKATHQNEGSGWKPSIHMPRWASRITLEITNIRVERLDDISANDCYSEGIKRPAFPNLGSEVTIRDNARNSFRELWESINGAGSWKLNPWLWVIEFKLLDQQIGKAA